MNRIVQNGSMSENFNTFIKVGIQSVENNSCKCAICGFPVSLTPEYKLWADIPNLNPIIYPVTKNGRPSSQLVGFICARCLGNANKMRLHIKSITGNVQVTKHAVERFTEKMKLSFPDYEAGKLAVIKAFLKTVQIRYKEKYMTLRLMSNRYKDAQYYRSPAGLVFVVTTATPQAIVTVESMGKLKLDEDYFIVK